MTATSKAGKAPRSMSKEERREQILAEARTVFAEKGYHGAAISEIVSRCGVAQGTFYLYFKSKSEVFEALVDDFTVEVFQALFIPGAEGVKTTADLEERLMNASANALRVFIDNQDMARILLVEASAREPGLESKVGKFRKRLVKAGSANMALWMKKGLLRKADPEVLINCVVAMTEGIALQYLNGGLRGDEGRIVEEIVRFELYGIMGRPGKRGKK